MLQNISEIFNSSGFMPHGHCFLWTPALLWTYILSDSIIVISYFSIPFALWYFVHKRRDVPFRLLFVMFGVFVMSCGTTHLLSVWNIWHTDYWADAVVKAITALISAMTAIVLWPLIPRALAIPSQHQLREANEALRKEIERRTFVENELRQMNSILQLRTVRLEAANQELESFSYSISHDLRSPLRSIGGFSHILLDEYAGKLDDEGNRMLNVIRDNIGRMGRLIDGILHFFGIGRVEMNLADIDMEALLYEVAKELRLAFAGTKLHLEIEPIPPACGDRALIHQVFTNLLSNAIKFSHHNEMPKVQVGGSVAGEEVVYFVKDNGVGFDMKYVDKLFGVSQRLHGVEEFEGTGIGLAIVKRIVTRHGGRVWAEGKINEGATVYFTLPKAKTA
jgi:light-regulated signal transduction histidine kinase (bacteriophytochrome)